MVRGDRHRNGGDCNGRWFDACDGGDFLSSFTIIIRMASLANGGVIPDRAGDQAGVGKILIHDAGLTAVTVRAARLHGAEADRIAAIEKPVTFLVAIEAVRVDRGSAGLGFGREGKRRAHYQDSQHGGDNDLEMKPFNRQLTPPFGVVSNEYGQAVYFPDLFF
jgi:hypothetical protein